MIGGTLSRYIAGHFLKNVVFTFLLFLGLIIAVDVIELSRQMARGDDANFSDVLTIALYRAPAFAENILPFATLFGAAATLLLLNRRLELVVARAAGVSVWQFLLPMVVTASLIGLVAATVYNPLAISARNMAEEVESKSFGEARGSYNNKGNNFWLRVGQDDGDVVIRARIAQDAGAKLTGVTVHRFSKTGASLERIDAKRAIFVEREKVSNYYLLKWIVTTIPGEQSEEKQSVKLPININKSQLQARSLRPTDVGFWNLGEQGKRATLAGRSALPFTTQAQALISLPFLFVAMTLIAATFSLRFARFGQSSKIIVSGILAGFMLYVVSKLVLTFGSNGLVPPPIAVWSPAIVATLIATTVLLHQEDG